MDFSNPTLSLLSKNTTQLSQTYVQNASNLVKLVGMLNPLYGPKSCKVLISQGPESRSQTLTDITKVLFDILPITSSNNIIIKEVLNKISSLGDGTTLTVLFCAVLSKNLLILVDKGVTRRIISDILKRIRREVAKIEVEKDEMKLIDNIEKIVFTVLKDAELVRVFNEACSIILKEKNLEGNDLKQVLSELDDRLRIVKVPVGTNKDSVALDGLVYKGAAKTGLKEVKNERTAIFNCPIEISRTSTKGVLLLKNAADLLNFSGSEEKNIEKCVDEISKNSNVVICSGKVEEMYLEYFNKKSNSFLYSLYSKHDIRRIRNLFGGSIVPLLKEVPLENCGKCSEIKVLKFGSNEYTWFRNEASGVSTVILKNSISLILDENERMIQKGIKTLQRNTINGAVTMVKGYGYLERTLGDSIMENALKNNEINDSYNVMVTKAVKESLYEVSENLFIQKNDEKPIYDIYNIKIKAIQYAIDICCVVLETQDQFAVRDSSHIKAKTNKNWDQD